VLSEQEIAAIREEMDAYPYKRAAVPEALRIVQRFRGWVPDEAVKDIGAFLGVGADEVEGVATFYNLIFRKPVGRHVILVCDSVSCWIGGCEGLRAALRRRLAIDDGQTTPDGRFTLLPIGCLGACDQAPALMVNGELHGNVTAVRIDGILEELNKDGPAALGPHQG
jgi:NADH-quinone oxidoreductase subunit E